MVGMAKSEDTMGIEHLVRPVVYSMRYGQHKVVCPSCGPQRKKKGDKTLSVKVDDETAVYQCWHCQEHGSVQLGTDRQISKQVWQADRIKPMAVAAKKKWDA
jgi:transposase-like protein